MFAKEIMKQKNRVVNVTAQDVAAAFQRVSVTIQFGGAYIIS